MDTRDKERFEKHAIAYRYYHGAQMMVFLLKTKQVFRMVHIKVPDSPCTAWWDEIGTDWKAAKNICTSLRRDIAGELVPILKYRKGRWYISKPEDQEDDLDIHEKVIFFAHRKDATQHDLEVVDAIPEMKEQDKTIISEMFPAPKEQDGKQ